MRLAAVSLLGMVLPGHAVSLDAAELKDAMQSDSRALARWQIKDFVVCAQRSGCRLNFDIDRHPENKRLFNLWAQGMDLTNPEVQRSLATPLNAFSVLGCDTTRMFLVVRFAQIPSLQAGEEIIGVKDARRIVSFFVGGCMTPEQREEFYPSDDKCFYSNLDTNDTGLDLHGMRDLLSECQRATGLAQGKTEDEIAKLLKRLP